MEPLTCLYTHNTMMKLLTVYVTLLMRSGSSLQLAPFRTSEMTNRSGPFCVGGRHVPKLYVLGAQKAATSSLYYDLEFVGFRHVGYPQKSGKEFHFLDRWGETYPTMFDRDAEREEWMKQFPPCDESTGIFMDVTPSNLRSVALPVGTRPTGTHWGDWRYAHRSIKDSASGLEMSLPSTLRYIYGDDASRQLVFVILLREPLSRMQSNWYHAQATGWVQCLDCKNSTFASALSHTLDKVSGLNPLPIYDDWLWASLYARQIVIWLDAFSADQLVVLPFKSFTEGNKIRVCNVISHKLDALVDCSKLKSANNTAQINSHEHRSLEEDISPELRDRFFDLLSEDNTRLVKILTQAHFMGATLQGYKGNAGDENAVWTWLSSGW